MSVNKVRVIDSHTAGEPTRVVIEGGPDLGSGSVAQRLERFRTEHDRFRSGIVNEPRGSDVLVGALLCEPHDASCAAGVIFFNNIGTIGMCGHGTIGVVATLNHLGVILAGEHRIELRYRNPWLLTGAVITGVAALLLAILLWRKPRLTVSLA